MPFFIILSSEACLIYERAKNVITESKLMSTSSFLFDQQSKAQRYSVFNNVRQGPLQFAWKSVLTGFNPSLN